MNSEICVGDSYSTGTLLLWLTYFMDLVIVRLFISWLPTLIRDSGASLEQAAFIGALFQFGGMLSTVVVGQAMDCFNPHKVVGLLYLLTGMFVWCVGQSFGQVTLLATLVLLTGMYINDMQSAVSSLAARFYPIQGRATGVSWMPGIGRFGAILGAWIGATPLGLGWNFEQTLTVPILPAAPTTATVLLKGLVSHADAG